MAIDPWAYMNCSLSLVGRWKQSKSKKNLTYDFSFQMRLSSSSLSMLFSIFIIIIILSDQFSAAPHTMLLKAL